MGRQPIDMTGKRSGRLVVIEIAGSDVDGQVLWRCQCECGNTTLTRGCHIRTGKTKSCGCLRADSCGTVTHGATRTRASQRLRSTHASWNAMRLRCNNPNHVAYPRYGGRGITICDRWSVFEAFLEDMGERPKGLSLDRINNDDGYCAANCRWSTGSVQSRNRCTSRMVEVNGIVQTLADWCDELDMPYGAVSSRINALRWNAADALTVPIGTRRIERGSNGRFLSKRSQQ